MKAESIAELNITLQLYKPVSEVLNGLSCKMEVDIFESSTAMIKVLLSRPDPTPGPNHVTFAVVDVFTAVGTVILHTNW